MSKIYSMDVQMVGTAYIRADSPEQALAIAKEKLSYLGIEVHGKRISGKRFNDPTLPSVSLSPAMTIVGPFVDPLIEEAE